MKPSKALKIIKHEAQLRVYGEDLVKYEGVKCKIFISSRLINSYFKGDQQLAIATFGHELYHSKDFANGYADYLFYTKGSQYQNDYMEWNAP